MEPSLALLITGEVRTGGQGLLQDLKRLDRSTVQPIFSVWDRIGIKLGGWIGPWQVARVLGEAVADSLPPPLIGIGQLERFIPEYFETLRAEVSKRDMDRRELDALTPYVDVEDRRLFVDILPPQEEQSNASFVHYKLARALALMQIAEQERGNKFDHVMRLRPDLNALPEWSPDFSDDEIFVDWYTHSEESGKLIAGDNVILACRDVVMGLAEYLRFSIYDKLWGNVHDSIGEFIERNGLKPRALYAGIAEDPWPLDLFLHSLADRVAADPDNAVARDFLACVNAYGCMARADFAGASAELDRIAPNVSPPVMLCRTRLALATGQSAEADAMMSRLQARETMQGNPEAGYYAIRLEQLRSQYLGDHVKAVRA